MVQVAAVEPIVEVTEVAVEGARHVHPDRVRFILDTRAGKSYPLSLLQQAVADDVKAIETMGPFTKTRSELSFGPDGRTVKVIYRFAELPYVVRIRYETFDKVDDQGRPWDGEGPWRYDLMPYFTKEKVEKAIESKEGAWLNPILLESDRRAVMRKLEDEGNKHARVEVVTSERDGEVTITYRVGTGPEIKVGTIVIEGLPKGVTMRAFEPGWMNPQGLLNAVGNPYQAELVTLDEGTIVRTLQQLGWLDARLVATKREIHDYVRPTDDRRRHGPSLVPDGDYNDRVALIYTLEPGERYTLGTVSFVGNTKATSEQLREAFRMPDGAWFRQVDLYGDGGRRRRIGDDESLGAVERSRRVISNQGYARCGIREDRRIDTVNHIVHLTLHLDEGGTYKIGRVDVRGNRVTRDAIVRRGMALNPGDDWNDDQLDESQRQIERTGLFTGPRSAQRPLKLEKDFPADRPGEVDLVVDVDEKASGSLSFQLGYSSLSGIFGSLTYSENNFDLFNTLSGEAWRGGNQNLSFTIFVGQDRTSLSTSWVNPHIWDGPYALSTTAFRTDSTQLEWAELRIGGTVGVSRYFLRNDLSLGAIYGYTDLDVDDIGLRAPDDVTPGARFWNSLGLTQSYDRLNDRQLPTAGHLLAASQTVNGSLLPGTESWAEYIVRGAYYVPLLESDDGGSTFLRFSARWKQSEAISPTGNVPFYARYRGGGPAPNHRGFSAFELSPVAYNHRTDSSGNTGFRSYTGGVKDALGTIELSYPVQGIDDGIRLVSFSDTGNVWGADQTARWGDVRTAVGFGIRFPAQFPVSLDFAWLVGPRESYESSTQVHFGIGQVSF